MRYLLLILLVSCANLENLQEVAPGLPYKKTLQMEIEGETYMGVAVFPLQKVQKLVFKPYKKPDVIKLNTCHRDIFLEKPSVPYKFNYAPTTVENNTACSMEIGVFSVSKGYEWGYIEFITTETLQGQMHCNGDVVMVKGVSICQAKKGLVQTIGFKPGVRYKTNCLVMVESQGVFEYQAPSGMCQVIFYDDKKNIHRHVVYGYEDILLRDQ